MGKQNRARKLKRRLDWAKKEAEIRTLVGEGRFSLTDHAYAKIATNYWAYDDVVASLLNGAIHDVDDDEYDDAIDGKTYTILGTGYYGGLIETVGKIVQEEDGREYLVITAY